MKRLLMPFIIVAMVISQSNAQVAWVRDLDLAIALAKQNDKLLMIDFWAVWCGPCKTMDREVWNTEEGTTLSQKFIPVKIDIDYNNRIALRYNVKSIPAVFFVDVTGQEIIDQVGFRNKSDILSLMESLPGNVKELNSTLGLLENDEDANTNYAVALAYQKLNENVNNDKIKDALLDRSDDYLKLASKKTEDQVLQQKLELTEIHNLMYRGVHKRAIKKLGKNIDDYPNVQANEAYINYLYVLAYKGVGDAVEEDKYYQQLQASADGEGYLELLTKAATSSENN